MGTSRSKQPRRTRRTSAWTGVLCLVGVMVSLVANAGEPPSKAECEQVFKKEKAQMNACVEKKCRGKDQQALQECHAGCAQERSDKYQACYAKYVLDW